MFHRVGMLVQSQVSDDLDLLEGVAFPVRPGTGAGLLKDEGDHVTLQGLGVDLGADASLDDRDLGAAAELDPRGLFECRDIFD